jgi:ribosome-associated toxin RatA of RatAB toxin-antitoxin module
VKRITGVASGVVDAPLEECFALLEAVDRYPAWNPELVPEVEVLERTDDGRPARARVKLRVARSRFSKDLELVVAVRADRPMTVHLTRLPNEPSDEERLELTWRLHAAGKTRIELELDAVASLLPAFIPLRGLGDLIARRLLAAATRALEPAPPRTTSAAARQ